MSSSKYHSRLIRKAVILPILIVVLSVLVIGLSFTLYLSKEAFNATINSANNDLEVLINSFDNNINSTLRLATIFSNSFEAQGGDIDSLLLSLKKAIRGSDLYIDAFVSDYKGNCRDINNNTFSLKKTTNDLLKSGVHIIKIVKSPLWEDSGFPILRIGVPINIYGNFQGGIFFDISMVGESSKTFNMITKSQISNEGYGFLLTPTGTVLVHKNSDYIWKNIRDIDVVRFQTPLKGTVPDLLRYTMFGQSKFAVGKIDPITRVKFYVAAYTGSIVSNLKTAMFLLFVAFIFIASFLAFLLYTQIKPVTEDVLELNEALKRVAKGDYNIDISTKSDTEIKDLAKNVLFMAEEIKDSMQQISSLKLYMENILNSLNEAVITADGSGKIEFTNDYARKLFEVENLDNLLIFDVIKKYDLNIYFDCNKVLDMEETLYFPDVKLGSSHILDIYVKSYKISDGKGILFIAYDVSNRVELEEHLSQIQRVQSLGLMASGVAHDFNNFLGAIQGYLDLMEIADDEEEKNKYITKAYNSIYEAKSMVNKLLIFTKKNAAIEKKVLKVEDVIENAIEMVQNNVGAKSIFFDFVKKGLDFKIEMNETEILQVLTNVFLNSIQAIESVGKITIKIESISIDSKSVDLNSGRYIKLIINDNGSGMTEKSLEKIFDPFFTTKKHGNGLGMYVVKSILQKNAGDVKVFSKEGIGTTVELYIPMYSGSIRRNQDFETAKYIHGSGQAILLVDDNEEMRNVIKEMLVKLNYKVYAAEDADSAFEIAREHEQELSLILLDVVMPKKDAEEFMYMLKQEKIDIPVVLMSGYTTKLPDEMDYPFYKEFLPKPFGIRTLSFIVAKNVRRIGNV